MGDEWKDGFVDPGLFLFDDFFRLFQLGCVFNSPWLLILQPGVKCETLTVGFFASDVHPLTKCKGVIFIGPAFKHRIEPFVVFTKPGLERGHDSGFLTLDDHLCQRDGSVCNR